MAQQLRTLPAHPEDPSSVLSTHTHQLKSPGIQQTHTSFWPPPAPTHTPHTCTQTYLHVHINTIKTHFSKRKTTIMTHNATNE